MMRHVAAVSLACVLIAGGHRVMGQGRLETLPVQGQLSVIAGAGGNVTVLAGPEGVMLVDAGRRESADQLLAAVRAISPAPIHFILNTNADADHVGGNAAIAKVGSAAPGSNQAGFPGAPIYAHENVLNRMSMASGTVPAYDVAFWPTVTFFTQKRTLYFNGEPIELLWQKAAHSDGDLFVFFRRSDVVSAGDILSTVSFPMIDQSRGGGIQGVIDGLNRLIDITIPRMNQMDGTRVVPGHGRICNEADVVEYRDMVTIVRDRVQALVERGQTLEQVQASRPAYEYEPLYGAQREWTPSMFVEAVFKTLKASPSPRN